MRRAKPDRPAPLRDPVLRAAHEAYKWLGGNGTVRLRPVSGPRPSLMLASPFQRACALLGNPGEPLWGSLLKRADVDRCRWEPPTGPKGPASWPGSREILVNGAAGFSMAAPLWEPTGRDATKTAGQSQSRSPLAGSKTQVGHPSGAAILGSRPRVSRTHPFLKDAAGQVVLPEIRAILTRFPATRQRATSPVGGSSGWMVVRSAAWYGYD